MEPGMVWGIAQVQFEEWETARFRVQVGVPPVGEWVQAQALVRARERVEEWDSVRVQGIGAGSGDGAGFGEGKGAGSGLGICGSGAG
jgi:hypothetical protein